LTLLKDGVVNIVQNMIYNQTNNKTMEEITIYKAVDGRRNPNH
jgi:hypothetical protein